MSDASAWLPPLLRFEDFGRDWQRYVDAAYTIFRRDFIESAPTLLGLPVRYRWRDRGSEPPQGKASTFWHVTTAGGAEPDRLPDLRRCERIGWIRAMIDAAGSDRVSLWESDERGERRILIALPDFSHLVVLARRESYVLLLTSFPVETERRRAGFRQQYMNSRAGKS